MEMKRIIHDVVVHTTNFATDTDELEYYVLRALERYPKLTKLTLSLCKSGIIRADYVEEFQPFHRLRRITGYLTTDLRSWNDAKQAEERDRVKHAGGD